MSKVCKTVVELQFSCFFFFFPSFCVEGSFIYFSFIVFAPMSLSSHAVNSHPSLRHIIAPAEPGQVLQQAMISLDTPILKFIAFDTDILYGQFNLYICIWLHWDSDFIQSWQRRLKVWKIFSIRFFQIKSQFTIAWLSKHVGILTMTTCSEMFSWFSTTAPQTFEKLANSIQSST